MQGQGHGPYQLSHVLRVEFTQLRGAATPEAAGPKPAGDAARIQLEEALKSVERAETGAKEARQAVGRANKENAEEEVKERASGTLRSADAALEKAEKEAADKALRVLDTLPAETVFPPDGKIDSEELDRRESAYRAAHAFKFSALCLSGGGIRSASIALGVIQGLADAKLLNKFDYLSTVSGGGYIGSWLTAWLHHSTTDEVLRGLRSRRLQADREPRAIRHLREYSSFLTPQVGLTSADTWAAVAILFRNMLLNWLILVPAICVPVIFVKLTAAFAHTATFTAIFAVNIVVALLCLVIGVLLVALSVGYKLNRLYFERDIQPAALEQKLFLLLSVVPAVFAGAAAAWLANIPMFELLKWIGVGEQWLATTKWCSLIAAAVIGAIVYGVVATWQRLAAARAAKRRAERSPPESQPLSPDPQARRNIRRDVAAWTFSGLVTGLLIWLGAYLYRNAPDLLWFGELCSNNNKDCTQLTLDRQVLLVVFGMPWLLVSMRFGQLFYVMLRSYSPAGDFEREWLGRAGGWHLIGVLAWVILSSLVFLGSILLQYWAQLAVLGALSGLVVRFLGKSSITPGKRGEADRKALASNIGLAIAGPAFAAILLILLSMAFDIVVVGHSFTTSALFAGGPAEPRYGSEWAWTGSVIAILVVVMLIADYFINVNRFSIHALYRNRLIRAFLGAGRGEERHADGFTGFDNNDNIRVTELWAPQSPPAGSWRPFHVINIALNLASSKRLAWQQRKAMSFAVNPLFCGAADLGYRRTGEYGNPDRGISLGTAMAVSGAAVSPNMGYHSSPSIAFLLTLFNVRLGWWLGNPGLGGEELPKWERRLMRVCVRDPKRRLEPYAQDAPWLAVRPLLAELFGLTDEDSSYVYLSDGGHFENLGVYEMVRRRCKWIVVIDGGQDPDRGFVDLGNAVLKVWIDLGVRINFPHPGLLQAPKQTDPADVPYFALGTIEYVSDNPVDPGDPPRGHILYIKPTVRGDESAADLISYQRAHAQFPHQSTGDQWFDEPQLEGYRVLGWLIIRRIIDAATPAYGFSPANLAELFDYVACIDPRKLGPGEPERP